MDPVVFLSTSPTFMLVQNGFVRELKENGLTNFIGQKTVGTRSYLHGNNLHPCVFKRPYDFSRTAGSVLRMFMLEASGMNAYYDPNFSTKSLNSMQCCVTSYPPGFCDQMAHGFLCARVARHLAAEFDRLFPHSVIEYELDNLCAGATKTISGHMYVIYYGEGIIYQIDATMDVKLFGTGREICANVHVAVSKYHFQIPMVNLSNEHIFRRFTLVQQLEQEWIPSQIPIANSGVLLPAMQNLTIQ